MFMVLCRVLGTGPASPLKGSVVVVEGCPAIGFAPGFELASTGQQGFDDLVTQDEKGRQGT